MAGNANDSFERLCAVCVTLLHESLEGMGTHAENTPFPSIYVNVKQVRVS